MQLESSSLEQDWGRMRVWRAGEGPIVIALHGLGGSGRYWAGLAAGNPDFTLVAPDLAGFGGSSKPRLAYTASFHCKSVDGLVARMSPAGPITLVGHSVGGVVAALWAARRPERIRAIALVASPFPGLHDLPAPVRWVDRDPYALRRRIPASIVRLSLFPLLAPVALARGNTLGSLVDFGRQSLPARVQTATSLMSDPSLGRELEGLARLGPDVREAILTGTSDRLAGSRDVDAWSRCLPHAEHLTHPGGHQLLLRGGMTTLKDWLAASLTA